MLSIILAKCTLKCKKCTFPPLKKGQALLHPPIFFTSDTPPVHCDVSPMLGASISVSNLAFKWGESISMGEVLYSTKWVKYSTLPRATTQNTTITHNNQHELPPPYPSAALALSLHGCILHGPKSWCCCLLWVRQWHNALGALLPLFYPLFWAPKCNPSKNRERDGVLALGGRRSVFYTTTNQKTVSAVGRGFKKRRDWGGTCGGQCLPVV
jgi:hypothetical protein